MKLECKKKKKMYKIILHRKIKNLLHKINFYKFLLKNINQNSLLLTKQDTLKLKMVIH